MGARHDPEGAAMIRGVKFVSIPVRDQDAALHFYTDKLGFAVATDQAMGEQRWIELRIPGADTRIVLFTPPGHESRIGSFSNITYVTDNVEKTHQELAAKGVVFDSAPRRESWGTAAVFKDLDGNVFVLSSK